MLEQPVKTQRADTPADIANITHLSHDEAEKVFLWAHRRAEEMRESGRLDAVVVLKEWAIEYPPDDPIADSRVLLVGKIEDYSEKAYRCRGAFNVDMSAPLEEELIDVLSYVEDDTQPTYVPKSAVECAFEL